MARRRAPWQDGRRAWERLNGWHVWTPERPLSAPNPKRPEQALEALSDIRLVRQLLDQAELAAVRAARLNGDPWSEIATRLGVTKQAAWERWHDLEPVTS